MHQKSQEDEPLANGEQWSESRTRTANAQLTAGNVNSPRNGEPNREFDAVDHHITVSQVSMDYKLKYASIIIFYSHNASKVPRR